MSLSIKESIEIEVGAGETVYNTIEDAMELSKNRNAVVWFVFNGVKINVRHTDNESLILQHYNRALQMGEIEVGKESYQ
jgi:hypothetical protein